MKRTRLAVAAVALVATGVLGACTSQPSTKAVVKDVVQSFDPPLPQVQQDCMLEVIDKMSDDQLKKLGAENLTATFTSSGGGNAAMQAFIKQLQECAPEG